jgi:hypothetical protein
MTPPTRTPLDEIRRLYFETTPSTILRDFDRAIDLLKSLPGEADRERAHVYMEGLAEMRKEFGRRADAGKTGQGKPPRNKTRR